ncbi:hypothetical protein [Neolewinella persica]|uniref:hypothetical protein n=1 Tax=Neolewinella persica TaxID=70998 RepID=UPI00036BD999|nr:hypothetical protein [Neolewinella persica]
MPDIFIEFGPRSILSLVGIVTIIGGVWHIDRSWDEEGSKAYERAKSNSDGSGKVTIPQKEKEAAFPMPIVFIVGWLIFSASYLFPTSGEFTVELSAPILAAMVLSVILSIVASVPMGDAVMNRKADKKKKLGMAFMLSWVGLTVATGLSSELGTLAYVFCGLGAMSIIAAMRILWKFRKMGDSWEQDGRPNPNPVVYNPGAPLFVFGWFLFWVGMASTNQGTLENGIPFYFNLRTAMAFFAGCGMVPVVMMIDYAHDEGAKYVGFGTNGTYFGRFFESPIPFITMWTIFGLSSFVAIDNTFVQPDLRKWLLLINSLLQAVMAGILIQTALYKGNYPLKTKLSMGFVVLFLLLAFNIGFEKDVSIYLAFAGAMLAIAGQKTIFGDRKRGDYWMKNDEENPNPIVYSYGELFFMAGWILSSIAIATPMD